jgi:hypothetical protein
MHERAAMWEKLGRFQDPGVTAKICRSVLAVMGHSLLEGCLARWPNMLHAQ